MQLIDLRTRYRDSYESRPISGISHVVFHHSATATPYNVTEARAQLDAIWRWHVGTLGWPGIGYHFLIDPFGNVYQVNDISDMSYHVAYNNEYTVGVCFLGNYENSKPSTEAINSARELVDYLNSYTGKALIIAGHAEINPASTAFCPSRLWPVWKKEIMADTITELRQQLANQMGINTELQKQIDALRQTLSDRDSEIGALRHDVIGKAVDILAEHAR